ncbi:MAG: amidase [Chlamydiales bacterium]
MSKLNISAAESNSFIKLFDLEPYRNGELSHLTFGIKDCIDVQGYVTGCGNPSWSKAHTLAASNAPCVDQLLAHGALGKGKTITDEMTFSLDGENFHYGTPLNPHAPERIPGGSSSGSASAVACKLVDFALGTDCGGSVRVPAANCGIFGMRPSYGAISTAGVMPFAPSFDTVGILANSYAVLEKVASTLLCLETPFEPEVGNVYLVKEAFALSDKEVRQKLEKSIEELSKTFSGKIKEISLQHLVEEFTPIPLHNWLETFSMCQGAEIWSTHGSWVQSANPTFGPRTQQNFEHSKQIDRTKLSYFIERREWYFQLMSDFLKHHDLLCFPTIPQIAPLKNSLGTDRYADSYYSKTLSICSIAGICRMPQISLPVATVDSAPIGLSLAAAHRNDAFLLWAASQVYTDL